MRALAFCFLLLQLGACAPRRPVTREECDRLLERYAEMLMHGEGARPSATERLHLMAEVRARAATHRPFQSCTAEVTREQMDCALAAFNPDEIERCLVPVP